MTLKLLATLQFLLVMVPILPYTSNNPNTNPLAGLPPIDPIELLNSMDPKELDKLMEELSRMTPEEIAYYEDLGKQMFKNSGYDVDAIAQGVPPAEALIKPTQNNQPKNTKPAEPKVIDNSSKKEKDSLMRMIKTLMDSIASIRQKASSDETLHPHIAELSQDLDMLHAYLNRMDYEKHLKHFEEKEFSALKTKLRKLSMNLDELDSNLSVPKVTLEKRTAGQPSNRLLLEKATSVLKQFKTTMKDAFGPQTLLTDIENLFKKYDTEALTIKKQIEESYKKASDQVLKIQNTKTNNGLLPAIPKYGQQPAGQGKSGYGTSGYPSASGSGQTQYPAGTKQNQPGAAGQQQTGAKQSQNPSKPGEKKPGEDATKNKKPEDGEKKDKDSDAAEVPQTIEQKVEKIKKELRSLNTNFGNLKTPLFALADEIDALATQRAQASQAAGGVPGTPAPVDPLSQAAADLCEPTSRFSELLVSFAKTKNDIKTVIDDAKKKDTHTLQKVKKDLLPVIDNQIGNITDIQAKFTAVNFRPFGTNLPNDIATAKDLMDSFTGIISSLRSKIMSRKID